MNPYVQQSIQAGLNTSNRFSEGYNRAKDENAIENILSQVSQMQDPRQVQSAIGQILSQVSPERRGDAMQFLQNTYQQMQNRQKEAQTAKAYEQAGLAGQQFLPPQVQSELIKQKTEQEKYNREFKRKEMEQKKVMVMTSAKVKSRSSLSMNLWLNK